MAAWRSTIEQNTPRLSRLLVKVAKKFSTELTEMRELRSRSAGGERAKPGPSDAYGWRSYR